jgi:hypothetical protein
MYNFTFASVGGTTRVRIQSGEDIRHLGELDQKMWTVLSCPTTELEIDKDSLQCMDSDNDGQLHVREVIAAAEWLCTVLRDPQVLFEGKAELPVDAIADETIAAVAKKINPQTITLAAVDEAIAAVSVETQPLPEAPYPANVIAAYKAKKDEYAAYFEQLHLQELGLARIAEDTPVPGMKEEAFIETGGKIAAYEAALAAANDANAAALAAAKEVFMPLRKLLLLARDYVLLLRNYITLDDFYRRDSKAIFQAGTLYIDQRACHLCIRVKDMSKQDTQAAASGMFLIYCDCTSKKLGKSMKIVAALTMGDVQNIYVGKNAIFYDRAGNDYEASIYKIIENPISIKQAFWSPYRRIAKWVEDFINKRAAEKDSNIMAETTAKIESGDKAAGTEPQKPAFDIAKFAGIFAAIGMAVGAIGTALVSVGKGFHALPWWQGILVIIGILLLISGPSMIMAAIKLRRRNLSPLLNANGWAVNAASVVNILFGATLTEEVRFPIIKLKDPFAKQDMAAWKKWCISLAALIAVVCGLWLGNLFARFSMPSPLPCFKVTTCACPVQQQTAEQAPACSAPAAEEAGGAQ